MSLNDPMPSEQKAEYDQKKALNVSSAETTSKEMIKIQKSAKRYAIGFTVIYTVLFPFFFYMGLLSSMVFANPRMTAPVGLLIIFLILSISLSMPVSIYLMWSRYLRSQYKETRFFCALPLLTLVGVFFMITAIEALL